MTIKEKIETLCARKGFTVAEVLAKCEISKATVGKWDKCEPGFYKLSAIAKVLGVPLSVFDDNIVLDNTEVLTDRFIDALMQLTVDETIVWERSLPGCYNYTNYMGTVSLLKKEYGVELVITTVDGATQSWSNRVRLSDLYRVVERSGGKVRDFMLEVVRMSEGVMCCEDNSSE